MRGKPCRLMAFCALLCCLCVSVELLADTSDLQFTPSELARIDSHGPWPAPLPPDPGNELSGLRWAEQLGETLFHDTQLSANGALSCATCHVRQQGFSDQLPLAVGVQKHVRNTQGLLDSGLQRWFGWDGGADSQWAAAMRPLLSPIEMAADIESLSVYLRRHARFTDTLGEHYQHDIDTLSNEAIVVLAAKSIAAFTRTLRSGRTAFDQFRTALLSGNAAAAASYPEDAARGLKIFLGEANCHVCHFGPNFSNGEFHDTGRPFFTAPGQVDPGRYTGIQRVRHDPFNLTGRYNGTGQETEKLKTSQVRLGQANWGQWRTPSLRNLTLTAPYMHDGSIASLRGVVDAYADIDPARLHSAGESILRPLALSARQREDLVAFLKSLSAN